MSHVSQLDGLQQVKVKIKLSDNITPYAWGVIDDTGWIEFDRNLPLNDETIITMPEEYAIVTNEDLCRRVFELDLGDIPLFIIPEKRCLVYCGRERKIMGREMPKVRVYPLNKI